MAQEKLFSEKEEKIFQAVLALAERGINLTTVKMQEIAAEAEIGKSTLYEYFVSKEELLLSAMSYCLEHEIHLLAPQLQNIDSFQNMIDVLLEYISGLVKERVAAYGMLGQVFAGNQETQKCPMNSKVDEQFSCLVKYAAALLEKDGKDRVDEAYLAQVLFSVMMGHAMTLLRLKKQENLSQEAERQLCEQSRKMLLSCIQ